MSGFLQERIPICWTSVKRMMTVVIVESNSVVPADAKEIWKALMCLFESQMKKRKKMSKSWFIKKKLSLSNTFFYLQLWLYENIVLKAMFSWDFHESGRVLTPTLLLSSCKNVDLINQSQQEIVAVLDEIDIVGWAPLNWAVEMLITQTFYFVSTFLLTRIRITELSSQ